MRTTKRLVVGLLLLTLAVLARKKKKQPPDGSDNGGMFPCTDVYVYGYFNHTKANGGVFVGWDNGQVADTDDNGVQIKMLTSHILNGICTPIPYMSDAMAEIDVGDPSLAEPAFYSWINFNKKNKYYKYKAPLRGGPTPANRSEDTKWEGGTARTDQLTVITTDVNNATSGIRTVTETTTHVITLTTEEIVKTDYRTDAALAAYSQQEDFWEMPSDGRRRLLGEDLEGPAVVETTNLPDLVDSCGESDDPNHPLKSQLDHPFPMCKSRTFEWSCEMTNIAAVTAKMRQLKEMQADDCWTINQYDVKCEGAPLGPQSCELVGGEIGANDIVVGVKITVNGDRCKACSLKEDLCPNFYDVHDCTYEFIKTTDLALAQAGYYDGDGESREDNPENDPNHANEFRIIYEINSGPAAAPASLLMSIAVAALVWFGSMP